MRLKYLGDGAGEPCTVFGLSFPVGEWVALDDPPAKLLAHPLFEVAKSKPPSAPRAASKAGWKG